jgi:hypothetical protein
MTIAFFRVTASSSPLHCKPAQAGLAPILIGAETRARHGAGKPTAKIIEDQTGQWWFLDLGLAFHRNALQLLTSVALAHRISESNIPGF